MLSIHEHFQSTIQGEGYHTGQLSDFIRLWGCPCACPWCDTGYGSPNWHERIPKLNLSAGELIAALKSPHVVITGGEPFVSPFLGELVEAILATGRGVSIETSGSYWQEVNDRAWVTLSPKAHITRFATQPKMWARANEIKLVISAGSEWDFYERQLKEVTCPIYLQPEYNERERTTPLCLDLIRQHPTAKLSIQVHKVIGLP